ncbi:MAG TPA: GNAT family N-acetyltransferase [Polyangiaceae bacterium]|nr:GNAT family N-acetyltransferase [Polyangiaceae bacterium]
MSEDWRLRHASKLCTAAEAIARILPGRRIFIGSGAAEPVGLVRALVKDSSRFVDNEVVHILTLGPAPYVGPEMEGHFRHTAFFIGSNVRQAVQEGRADFMPVFLSEVPQLIRSRRVKIDVALLQVTPPDARGYVSLGVSVDVVKAALDSADIVIAQVNARMPRTLGDSLVSVAQLDCLVELAEPLAELAPEAPDEVASRIGELVATLVPDGATLQAGIGRIPNAILSALRTRHDLGVHTEMFSDGLMELAKLGVINGKRKTLCPGKMVTSFLMGSGALYTWAHENPLLEMHASDFTNDPFVIAKNSRMISVNSALSVDLTGQVAADTVGGRFFSGIGGQVDFIRGAARSAGGKPIIALPSTAVGGTKSRIVGALEAGAGVVTSRGDVHYVVTEYGIAQLWGKSIRERASALIEVAHPDFRVELLNEAKARHYVFPDHPLPNLQPPQQAQVLTLQSGERVEIRPVRVSDEDALQDLLYRLSDESAFLRFFGHPVTHPHREVLRLVELDPTASVAFVARLVDSDELLGIARADGIPYGRCAEIGVTVADAWQNRGIGAALLERLTEACRAMGFETLLAEVLPANGRMQRLLRRHDFTCSGDPLAPTLEFQRSLRSDAPVEEPTPAPGPRFAEGVA